MLKTKLKFLPNTKNKLKTQTCLCKALIYFSNTNCGLTMLCSSIPKGSSEPALRFLWVFIGSSERISDGKVFLSGKNRVKGTEGWSGDSLGASDTGIPWCALRKRVYPSASSSSLKQQSASSYTPWARKQLDIRQRGERHDE